MSLPLDTLKRLEELTLEGAGKTVVIDGQEYSTTTLHDPRKPEPEPTVLVVHTLTALADYIRENRDGLEPKRLLLHVVSPTQVDLRQVLQGRFQQRFTYVTAKAVDLWKDLLAGGQSQEEFVTALLSRCSTGAEHGALLKVVGNVVDTGSQEYRDDGVKQTATVRRGIQVLDEIEVKNPWTLAPYRTFREVEQPESPFILRIGKGAAGPRFQLHECDGGAWRLEAVSRIRLWLEAASLGVPVFA